MNLDSKMIGKIQELISAGNDVLHSPGSYGFCNKAKFYKWRLNCLSLLRSVGPARDNHYLNIFEKDVTQEDPDQVMAGLGLLEGLVEDVSRGYFKRVEDLVIADVFTDFLQMAGHLLSKGYKDPGASLVGAVLEDGLKKIAIKNGIKVTAKDEISSLSQKLSDTGVFNKLKYSQIQSQTKIRNHADHGEFREYSQKDVEAFLEWTRDFLEEYL